MANTPTSGADVIIGTSGIDIIDALEGDDIVQGRAGPDTLTGGIGRDRLYGGASDDVLDGGADDDVLDGGAGQDDIYGGEGSDRISAGKGDDVIDGGSGDDLIRTGQGNDKVVLSGDFGNDTIIDFKPDSDFIDLTAFVDDVGDLTFTPTPNGKGVTITGPFNGSIQINGVTQQQLLNNGSILVACFVRGTLIATPKGEAPVETLCIGDEVTTLDGQSRPIKWIGRRSFSTRFIKKTSRVAPVLVRASALGEGLPRRDLRLSPEHALYVDGVMVPAIHLLNGTTIVRDVRGEVIDYFHIELEGEHVVYAEGAPAETFVNHNSRKMFQNWEEYVALYGDDEAAIDENGHFIRAFECVDSGPRLEAIRERLRDSSGLSLGRAA